MNLQDLAQVIKLVSMYLCMPGTLFVLMNFKLDSQQKFIWNSTLSLVSEKLNEPWKISVYTPYFH